MNKNFIIDAKNISKSFKKKQVLKNISLQIREGEIYGILGPNGAGKTTLISILSGILISDRGTLRIFNEDIKDFYRIKMRINVVTGNPNFIWCMTVYENLNYFGMLYGLNKRERQNRIEKYCSLLEMSDSLQERFDNLSSGLKQRFALCKALLTEPEILFLDEPTIGLDPDIAIKVRNLIKKLNEEKNTTMIVTTHYMQEAEFLCNRISFLKNGDIIIEGSIDEVKRTMKLEDLESLFIQLSKR